MTSLEDDQSADEEQSKKKDKPKEREALPTEEEPNIIILQPNISSESASRADTVEAYSSEKPNEKWSIGGDRWRERERPEKGDGKRNEISCDLDEPERNRGVCFPLTNEY